MEVIYGIYIYVIVNNNEKYVEITIKRFECVSLH